MLANRGNSRQPIRGPDKHVVAPLMAAQFRFEFVGIGAAAGVRYTIAEHLAEHGEHEIEVHVALAIELIVEPDEQREFPSAGSAASEANDASSCCARIR